MDPAQTREEPGARLARLLRHRREEILAEWEDAVRALSPAAPLERPSLRDNMPEVLEGISERAAGERAAPVEEPADQHARERLDQGFDLAQVVAEYHVLRECLFRAAAREGIPLGLTELNVVNGVIDKAIAVAVSRFARARERTLEGLERIALAAIGHRDTADVLTHLLKALLQNTADVDTAMVLLREGDELVMRAAVGLEATSGGPLRMKIGEGFAGTVAREQRPRLTRSAATDPLVRNPVLKQHAVRALYGIPLIYGGELVGVAKMGSRTAYEFSEDDLLFFRLMTDRATALLVQADLSARERRARAEAERSLVLVDTLLQTAPVGMAFLDTELRYVRVNEALARSNGRSVEEHLGRRVDEVVTKETAAQLRGVLERVVRTGQPASNLELEAPLTTPPAERRAYLANFYPAALPGGQVFGVGSVVVDITERKRAEDALRESDRRFRLALHNSGIVVFEQDRALRYRWIFNPQAGFRSDEVVGHDDHYIFRVPEEAEQVSALKRRVIATGQAATGEAVLSSGGESRHFLVELEPVRGDDGEITGVVGAATDITERKRYEEDLQRTAGFREQFIGVLGHDLRNPLNAIKASTHLLLRQTGASEAQTRAVRRIANSADKMARMISDILDFARGRLGSGIPVDPEPTDMAEVAAHAVEELHLAHPDRKLELKRRGDTRGEWDADRLAQVVGNLVANALQHSTAEAAVTVTVEDAGAAVELRVHNEGPPIPDEARARLFEPFRSSTGSRAGGGLGLGLFIVQQLVRAHDGDVEVHSAEGDGTTFRVVLPRQARRTDHTVERAPEALEF